MSEFRHFQAAHCESGATSSLLRNSGLEVSEAMAFGIGSGLFFVHIPAVKVMGLPLTSYRSMPGGIFKKTCRRLGIPFHYQNFRDPLVGRRVLEAHAEKSQAVGLRGNIFWLPYIPEKFRFQFNAHHFVVYGKNGNDEFKVSDPVLEDASVCASAALSRSRFSKGPLSPKGLIFYPKSEGVAISEERLRQAVYQGIRETVHGMVSSHMFFAGANGIGYLSRRMQKWPKTLREEGAVKLNMANVVRMQEEIGTGGAGFRFLYAAFLQEAGERLEEPDLLKASRALTEAGNVWREFATLAAKFCKDRLEEPYARIPEALLDVAARERAVFRELRSEYL